MKITYRNHPALKLLEEASLQAMKVHESDSNELRELQYDMESYFADNIDKFKSSITVITKPFEQSTEKAKSKLYDLVSQKIENNEGSNLTFDGTFISDGMIHMIVVRVNADENQFNTVMYLFSKAGNFLGLRIEDYDRDIHLEWLSKGVECDSYTRLSLLKEIFYDLFFYNIFKKYAEVETHIVKPNKKIKTPNYKYFNDTKLDFTVLNSTWFTNLVRSEGFKVRGHFRLQPCGVGLKERKLIWISDFEKEGYARRAGKDIENEK